MNRRPWRLVVALVVAVLVPAAVAAQPTTITVLHVNDTHSHLDAYGPKDWRLDGTLGGLAKAAAVVRQARAHGENVLFLHAGDAFVGDFFFNTTLGVAEMSLLRSLGVDAMTVGNHEFDNGPSLLTQTLSMVPGGPPPMLSANANTAGCLGQACEPLTTWIRPGTLLTRGGVKIGVFGMTTPDDPTMRPSPVVIEGAGGVPAGPGLPPLVLVRSWATAAALRAAGAQVVIMLSHLGLAYDQAVAANQPAPLIDFVIGGHDHLTLAEPVRAGSAMIFSAGQFYDHVGRLRFTVDGPHVTFDDYDLLPVGKCVRPDPWVQWKVDGLKKQIVGFYKEDVYKRVIGWALRDIPRKAPPGSPARDTAMGNLVTDAYRFKTRSDVALAANGYIADVLYRGPVVGVDVFRAVPYGIDPVSRKNYPLVVIGLKGSELLKGVEMTLSYLGVSDALFLQVSGLRYFYDSRKPVGARLVGATVNGEPVDFGRVYAVTANYAVAVFARDLMRLRIESWTMPGLTEYDAMRDWVKRVVILKGKQAGRVVDVALGP
jgi:2',3'-cyclic-nucleotide 2'-phosphodiesterase (5'-nucleotidase family)